MASELERAKRAIKDSDSTEPELNAALEDARTLQHKVAAENNRHKEAMREKDLGWFGRIFGGETNSPMGIATIAVIFGILGAFASGWMASQSQHPDSADFWSKQTERSIAFAVSALSFIFGRSSGRK